MRFTSVIRPFLNPATVSAEGYGFAVVPVGIEIAPGLLKVWVTGRRTVLYLGLCFLFFFFAARMGAASSWGWVLACTEGRIAVIGRASIAIRKRARMRKRTAGLLTDRPECPGVFLSVSTLSWIDEISLKQHQRRPIGDAPCTARRRMPPTWRDAPGSAWGQARNSLIPNSCPQSRPCGCPVPFAINHTRHQVSASL